MHLLCFHFCHLQKNTGPVLKMKETMTVTTIITAVIAGILLILGYSKGVHLQGLQDAYKTAIKIVPILIFAFIIIGMMNSLISANTIKNLVGNDAGIKGILIGTFAGIITPGGTFVALSFAGTLLKSNAAIGTVVAYITAYSIFDITRTPIEIGFMGWKYILVKWCSALILPIISGMIARQFFSWVNF